jgi:hypothetical protein
MLHQAAIIITPRAEEEEEVPDSNQSVKPTVY